ncbi:hypothetical protein JHK82_054885 [Glycine max]|nr:hypothetical protein JHK82_054885 [Glycine max]
MFVAFVLVLFAEVAPKDMDENFHANDGQPVNPTVQTCTTCEFCKTGLKFSIIMNFFKKISSWPARTAGPVD